MELEIDLFVDGCRIIAENESFSWEYNDEELGTPQIKKLLEFLGHTVNLEEVY